MARGRKMARRSEVLCPTLSEKPLESDGMFCRKQAVSSYHNPCLNITLRYDTKDSRQLIDKDFQITTFDTLGDHTINQPTAALKAIMSDNQGRVKRSCLLTRPLISKISLLRKIGTSYNHGAAFGAWTKG